ncbi:MAG: OsmC family protein [Candidatus Marinimicrobia bacterium]|nr:OsmC family protein [Candidatus Neomarinimicrobiota bacterium]
MTEVEVRRVEGSTFLAKGPSNHWVVMDAKPEDGGQDGGARPMELVLMAMGGCSGIDIELILRKMRLKLSDFRIHLKGERADSDPRVYTKIHAEYHFWGRDLPREKLERAVKLSEEKYCSVSNMLNRVAAVTTEVILHPED